MRGKDFPRNLTYGRVVLAGNREVFREEILCRNQLGNNDIPARSKSPSSQGAGATEDGSIPPRLTSLFQREERLFI